MKVSAWKTATINKSGRSVEFTGDDVDQYSDLIDLKENYEFLTVRMESAILSATITPYVQEGEGIDEVPVPVHVLDDDATGSFAHATTDAVTQISVTFRIGGYQFFRLKASANQSAGEAFKCRGFNREPLY